MARYASQRPTLGGRTGSHDYYNQDGPGNTTIDYGPHGPRDPTPSFTPDPLTNPDYFVRSNPQLEAQREQQIAAAHAANRAAYNADPTYAAAAQGGDLKGAIARMTQMKQAAQQQRFIDQGGTAATWQNRFDPNNNWPVPRSPSGNYQYGPGRPGPTPPGVAQGGGYNPGASSGTASVNAAAAQGGLPGGMWPNTNDWRVDAAAVQGGPPGGMSPNTNDWRVDAAAAQGGMPGADILAQMVDTNDWRFNKDRGGWEGYDYGNTTDLAGYNENFHGSANGNFVPWNASMGAAPPSYAGGQFDASIAGKAPPIWSSTQEGNAHLNAVRAKHGFAPVGQTAPGMVAGGNGGTPLLPGNGAPQQGGPQTQRTAPPGTPTPALPTGPRGTPVPYNPTPVNPNPPPRSFPPTYGQPFRGGTYQGPLQNDMYGGMLMFPGYSPYGGGFGGYY